MNHFNQRLLKNGKAHLVQKVWSRKEKMEYSWRRREKFKKFHVNDKRKWYREEYLKSDHWKSLRRHKLAKYPYCQNCGSTHNLDVHHRKCRHVYDVQINDLLTLCRSCHTLEHKKHST